MRSFTSEQIACRRRWVWLVVLPLWDDLMFVRGVFKAPLSKISSFECYAPRGVVGNMFRLK